ncbi:MAG: hypothetical protein WAW03_16225 [Anaerolineae bacterium]
MTYATQALKRALLYDERAATLTLSPHIPDLNPARNVLLAAFGNHDVLLEQVHEIAPPADAPEGVELLCLAGKGDIFNYPELDVYLEFGLRGANLLTMLILAPLPEQWNVRTVFEKLPGDILPAEGVLTQATIVISYGLAAVPDNQIVNEYDRHNPNVVNIARYPLQNGFQILAASVARAGSAADDQVLEEARRAGIPQTHLPEPNTSPNRVEIRADVSAGWLVLERWWGELHPNQAAPLAENVHPAGLAYRYSLTDPNDFSHYWLLAVGAPDQPIILEAHVLDKGMVGKPDEFFSVRYTSRFATRTPLKQAGKALAALLGEQVSIFDAQELSLPDAITLLGFAYAPGEWVQCTFAAGDSTSQDAYLVQAGPLELREVDFTVWAPIGKSGDSPSIELEATTSFFGEQFRVRVRPWTLIEGGLDDPDGVDLGGLMGKLLPAPLPFGLDSVRLTQAWVSHAVSGRDGEQSSTDLHLRLDGKVDLLPGVIELDEIGLFFSEESDGGKNASLSAQFKMGSAIEMSALASYDGGGWVFRGEVGGDGDGIHINELINQLAQLFGATVPAEAPDVTLDSFSLEYAASSRSLTIQAVTDWKIPDDIPVLAGTDNRVLLQLTMARAGQQGESETALAIEWTLEKGGYGLDANVMLAKDTQTYSVDFSVPDPKQPVTLTALTDAIGLPDIPKPAAEALDTVFQVSHLALDYSRTEKTFSVAWSRPLGQGMFLAEYSQSGGSRPDQASDSSKAGAASRAVEVSWLGNDEESTLGIQDVLKLVGQEHLEDDLKDLAGDEVEQILEKIDELLTFKQLGFAWQENDQQNTLLFTALSKYRQAKAFVAVRSGENEGLVAGIAFADSADESTHSNSEDLTFLPEPVHKLLKVVAAVLEHIELTHLLFSTVSSSAYQPPAFAASAMQPSYARQDAGAPSFPFGTGTMTLGQGVSVGARVKFGQHDIVRRVIDVDELDGQVTVGDVVALQVSIPGRLKLDAGGGNSLVLTSPMLRIKENLEIPEAGPEFDIMGGLDIHFVGQRLQMTGWIALAEESLTGHVQMTELALSVPLTPIYQLPGVQLVINQDKPLSLDLGLQFEPSGLDLGLSGSFAIYKDDKNLVYGDAGFVLEVEGEVVQPLYVEFGTDELSIPVLLEALTGVQYRLHLADSAAKLLAKGAEAAEEVADDVADQVGGDAGSAVKAAGEAADKAAKGVSAAVEAAESALGHLEAILSKVEFRDVRIHWADSIVNLPDGATVMPGVGIRGGLRIFDWDAFAVLDLSTQGIPGFSGHLEAEKIEIGRVLKIWGDGQGIHKTPKTADDFNQQVKSKVGALAAGQQRPVAPAVAKDVGDWFLKPGGPVLHLSTRSAPFLHADLHAQLFGFLQTDIHADITAEGFDFDFKIGAGNEVTAELECHWWHQEGKLEAHGDLGIHLHGDIGPIIPHVAATQFHLDTDLDAHVALMIDNKEFKLTINGSFEYQGASLHLPELVLVEEFSTLEALAKAAWDHVVNEAETIFEQYLAPIGKFVEEGAQEVAHVAVAAAKEVAEVATAAASEAKQIVSGVADTMDKAAGEIGQDAKNLAGEAENLAKNAEQAALDAAGPLLEKVADLGQKALQFAADAAASVKAIVADAAALVSEAAHYAIQVAAEAAQWVAGKLDEARRWVSARLDQAKVLLSQLAHEAEEVVRAIEADIEEVERRIEEFFSRAAHMVEDTVSSGWHAATSWL